ncbi:MAG: prepilin peptidase [Candidatus Aenigmarchaeota archaeon]|nr:prepilin peptidase [Candidatus Aenigmarchaeota archaeon]
MIEWLLLAIGIAGFGVAGYLDLKTTEFPDWIPYAMIGLALLIRGAYSAQAGDMSFLYNSIAYGTVFLGFGLSLYYLKQWGDGDAWLLGSLGFLFPDSAAFPFLNSASILPFPLVLILNFFLVSFLYVITYSIILGIKENALASFAVHLRGQAKTIVFVFLFFCALAASGALYLSGVLSPAAGMAYILFPLPFLAAGMIVFVIYGQYIEKNLLRKRVATKDLRLGDVPADGKWKVMTKWELARIRKAKKYVWVKEGVRFAPVFLLTLLFILVFGSVF